MADLIENAEQNSEDPRIAEKDQYINQLKAELEDLKVRIGTTQNMEALKEEFMGLLETRNAPKPPEENSTTNRQEPGPEAEKANLADLAEQVKKILSEENTKNTRERNVSTAKENLKQLYGGDYTKTLEELAGSLGVGVNFLTEMAARSPKGLVDLVQMHKPLQKKDSRTFAPPANSLGNQQETTVRKNATYYRELRKSDPSLYLSRRIQAEMHREAMEQGDAFYQ